MRADTKLGLTVSLFAALLVVPSSTAAQCSEWEQWWGDDARPMSLLHATQLDKQPWGRSADEYG